MRDSNSFPAPKPKEVYEVQFRVISRRSLDCLLQGPLIKSYITGKPPIAPNSKQLSQLLLPTQPHGGSLRRGLCLGVRGGQLGDRFNIMWGHVLMLLWKCFLWSIRLQSPSYVGWGGVRRDGVEKGAGEITVILEDQRIQPVKCYDIFSVRKQAHIFPLRAERQKPSFN